MTKDQRAVRFRALRKESFARVITAALRDPNMGAGVQISGVSGSGKSNLAEWLFPEMVRAGVPSIFFDPHGTSARKVLRMCQSLPPRIRRKVWYLRVADPTSTAAINPLFVPRAGLSAYEWEAALRVAVESTAQIILSLFGETQFGSRPVLRKWLTRWLYILAQAGLTLADAELLMNPRHPVYRLMLDLIEDEFTRFQMEALTELTVADLEAEIGSARNRTLAALEHPTCQAVFSRREHTLDFRYVYDNDISLIVDLDKEYDKKRILSDDARELVCNLYLNQYLATVFSTPEEERRDRLCYIDELAVFQSSAPMLAEICTEIRKYRTKFLFLHQGSSRFPARHENEFLQTMSDMCRVHLFFRHGPADARFFGERVMLATWDGKRVKHVQETPQQFTVGHELRELMDRGDSIAEGNTTGTTEGTTDALTDTLATAATRARAQPDAPSLPHQAPGIPTTTESDGQTRSTARATGTQHSTTETSTTTRTASRTIKQTLVPTIVTRAIVSSIQFYTPEEIDRDIAATIASFDAGEAILQIDGLGTYVIKTPLACDPLIATPKFAQKVLTASLALQRARPEFASPDRIRAERTRFLERLASELRALQYERRGGIITVEGALPSRAGRAKDEARLLTDLHSEAPTAPQEPYRPEGYEGDF